MGMVERGAQAPEELAVRFVQCVGAGDVEGIVGLYADDAIVTLARGREAVGAAAIRAVVEAALAAGDDLGVGGAGGILGAVESRAVLAGPLAMTSFTGTDGVVRAQVARREPSGAWVWVRDGSTLQHLAAPDLVDVADVA